MTEGKEDMRSLALTPTWSVAVVLTIFVFVSLLVERSIHRLSSWLQKTNRNPLFEAVEKMKEELMLLGFISLLLTATSSMISNICIETKFYNSKFSPCSRSEIEDEQVENESSGGRQLLMDSIVHNSLRRLLNGLNQNTCSEGFCLLLCIFIEMAIKTSTISIAVAFFGVLAFIFGVIAENKKPAAGSPITGKDVVICKFPSDPTVALGSLSVITLAMSTVLGLFSVFYSYKGKYVPKDALFQSTSLIVFFGIALAVSALGSGMMLWATITESLHHIHNVHHDVNYECPTAKTGLFGGAAFLALDASLFWLICQMLTLNARADYLEEDPKGDYGQVLATDYDARPKGHGVMA